MSNILLQTTIPYAEDDWHVGRFSMLVRLLTADGHSVVARDRMTRADGSDPMLSALAESEFDQLWLIAVDTGNGLAPADVRGILRFRERGGGVLSARDADNRGASLLNLGTIGTVNNFSTYNRRPERRRFPRAGRSIPEPASDNFQGDGEFVRIVAVEPVHELLRSPSSPSGLVEHFPAHPQDAALSVPGAMPYARVIATSSTTVNGRSSNLVVAIENEPAARGHASGRAVALSTFHQLADVNWDKGTQASSSQPSKLDVYKDYVRNLARWLSPQGHAA